jgi:hypothetical protein
MGRKLPKSINLIDPMSSPGDTFSIFYEWAISIGKYLLIIVQLLVIAVFIMRFSVDKINNDLTREINTKIEFLLQPGFKENEMKFRNMQVFFNDIAVLDKIQEKHARQISAVLDTVPQNVHLETLSYTGGNVAAQFTTTSLENVKSYESFLKQSPVYSDVRLSLEKKGDFDSEVKFTVNYQVGTIDE